MDDMFDEIELRELVLRDYQLAQNNAVRSSAQKGNRRIISCMATGSGKSAMLADLAKSALDKMKRVIIVLPRRSLVRQLSRSFHEWGINHGVVMSKVARFTLPRCQIISIDTYMNRVSAGRMELIDADLLVIDELQIQWSKKKLDIFKKYKMVVAFSATPVAPKGESLGLFYDDIVETITMQQLMDQDYLTPLKYFADPNIDLSKVKIGKDGDWIESQLGKALDKPKLVGDIFDNWLRITGGTKPTVVFCSSQSHARHICDEMNSHGYNFDYVDCNTSDDDRKLIFGRVESGEIIGIANVSIISVGIDIPNLEVCVLARPTRLVSVYLQCVGRVTRKSKGKEFGIVIDHAGIIERLGIPTDDFEWSLDGKESVEDRMRKKKEEKKEPKEIVCSVPGCGYVFKSSRRCPKCGNEMISRGEPIPVHEAKLIELVRKPTPEEKKQFYSELLGYCRRNSKPDSLALAVFKAKHDAWPFGKYSVAPTEPSQETINYIRHRQIAYAKGMAKRG